MVAANPAAYVSSDCGYLIVTVIIIRECTSRRQTVPEKGHQKAKSNVDHDGHVNVPHVVLGHMSISCSQLWIPAINRTFTHDLAGANRKESRLHPFPGVKE